MHCRIAFPTLIYILAPLDNVRGNASPVCLSACLPPRRRTVAVAVADSNERIVDFELHIKQQQKNT
jgi:hypothetical protein